jgi:hypothetical protein
LAQIVSTTGKSLNFATGASYLRFIGVEITRTDGTGNVYALVQMGGADHVIFDRCYVHGVSKDETNAGIQLQQSKYVAVVDSYLSDFHCTAGTGACTDAKTIGGGLGTVAGGPYKMVGNYLEASGENILFGGGAATATPADIEVRRNHHNKPRIWEKSDPNFIGTEFIVKNLFELKNAERVLLEGNVLENSWQGYSQNGSALLLTPKNQSGACPLCRVNDITVRLLWISNVGSGLQIANGLSDSGDAAKDGGRYSIHDLVIEGINAKEGGGRGFQISSNMTGQFQLHDVAIAHVTAFPDPSTGVMSVGAAASGPKLLNFTFVDNIVTAGQYPIWSTGGGTGNCASSDVPVTVVQSCFSPVDFSHNAIFGATSNFPPSKWPTGNDFPTDGNAVGFVSFANGNGGDYHLSAGSPFKAKASDGKDIGADIDAIEAATAGVAP